MFRLAPTSFGLPLVALSALAVPSHVAASRTYSCVYGYDYSPAGILNSPTEASVADCMARCDSWGDVCAMGQLYGDGHCYLYSAHYTAGSPRSDRVLASCHVGPHPAGYQCQPGQRFDPEAAKAISIQDTIFSDAHCAEYCNNQKGCTGFYIEAGKGTQTCHLATTSFDNVSDDLAHLCVLAIPSYSCYYGYTIGGGDLGWKSDKTLTDCLSSCDEKSGTCVAAFMDYSYFNTCHLKKADYETMTMDTTGSVCQVGPPPAGYQCSRGQRFDPNATKAIGVPRSSFTDLHCAQLCTAESGCTGFYVQRSSSGSCWTCHLATDKFDLVQDVNVQLCVPKSTSIAQKGLTSLLV